MKSVYGLQFVSFDTNSAKGISKELEDKKFIKQVEAHPMKKEEYQKNYKMLDSFSGQTIPSGLEMIQIELTRACQIRKLSPSSAQFIERSQDFDLRDWWLCALYYAHKFDPSDMPDKGNFKYMPLVIRTVFGKLLRKDWDNNLACIYDAAEKNQIDEAGVKMRLFEVTLKAALENLIFCWVSYDFLNSRNVEQIPKHSLLEGYVEDTWKDIWESISNKPPEKTLEAFIELLKEEQLFENEE